MMFRSSFVYCWFAAFLLATEPTHAATTKPIDLKKSSSSSSSSSSGVDSKPNNNPNKPRQNGPAYPTDLKTRRFRNADEFEQVIKQKIEKDEVVVVRFLPTAACSSACCKRFEPLWLDVTSRLGQELSKSHSHITFADVNMLDTPALNRSPYNPGRGGWPTIRYFTKDTGVNGAVYNGDTTDQQQQQSLPPDRRCMALSDDYQFHQFLARITKFPICRSDGDGCDERSKQYLASKKGGHEKMLQRELDHLRGKLSTYNEQNIQVHREKEAWINTRIGLLEMLLSERKFESDVVEKGEEL